MKNPSFFFSSLFKIPFKKGFFPDLFPVQDSYSCTVVLGLVLFHSQAAQGRKWALPTVRITHDIPFGVSVKLNIRTISLCWIRAYAYKVLRKPVLPQHRTVEQIKYYKIFFFFKNGPAAPFTLLLRVSCKSNIRYKASR